jgi:16S rRNA (guanine966-N2)-methyltransferase
MLHIIAGIHRGKKIETKAHSKIRPTGGMARGAIFNILMHGPFGADGNSPLIDKKVIDVFCGTGALGLEALSRGAAHVTFVDESSDSIALAHENTKRMGEEANAVLIRSDSTSLPKARSQCSLAFLDPPYNSGLATKSLLSLANQGWLETGAIAVVEVSAKETMEAPKDFEIFDERKYGNSKIFFLRYIAAQKE